MKCKTLLLGTAAISVVPGGAHAAAVAVAESVEYVKVCDAYGAGYFYIPGSDICLKISGDIEFDAFYNSVKQESFGNIAKSGADPGKFGFTSTGRVIRGSAAEDDTNWWFRTRAEVQLTANSMTDWGTLTSFANLRAERGTFPGNTNNMYAETAWAKIGAFKAGWDVSTFDADFVGAIDTPTSFDHHQHQNQVQWSRTVGGLDFFLGIEDPNDNGSGIHGSEAFATAPNDSDNQPGIRGAQDNEWKGAWPDIVAAATGSAGPFDWKASLGATDTRVGAGFGGQLWGQWLQGENSVTLQAAVSNGAGALYGANIQPNGYGSGTYWHVAGQAGFAVTSAFTFLVEAGYAKAPGPSAWEVAAEGDWTVGEGAVLAAEFYYLSKDLTNDINKSSARVDLMFKRSFEVDE